jgi:ribosomal protein S3AE
VYNALYDLYEQEDSKEFVIKYVSRVKSYNGKNLYADFMRMYLNEVKERWNK